MLARFPTQTETAPAGVLGPVAVTVQAQAVPTSVAVGPDGALYVGGLRGVPSLPGTADVYRVVPGSGATVYATGFSAVTDIAFDRSGNLLVLEYNVGGLLSPPSAGGALISVNRFTHQQSTLISSGLTSPTGLAVGSDGAIYISNNGTSAGSATPSGQILKFS
jgi:sugar lactone lactonase YvrE